VYEQVSYLLEKSETIHVFLKSPANRFDVVQNMPFMPTPERSPDGAAQEAVAASTSTSVSAADRARRYAEPHVANLPTRAASAGR